MNNELRNKRVRELVSLVNQDRKKQRRQIDVLCNDLIGAQREFIKRLGRISFRADFYESIIATRDIDSLLQVTEELIFEEISDCEIAIFLYEGDNNQPHSVVSNHIQKPEHTNFLNYFTSEVVEHVCSANKVCGMQDLYEVGFSGNPSELKNIAVVTIPLGQFGKCFGFILLYRMTSREFTEIELNLIGSVTPGLSEAIQSCRMQPKSA
jgi:hypothetical protein